jgi:GTPase SAR1 family protein
MCPDVPFVLVGLKTDLRNDADTVRQLEITEMGSVKVEDAVRLARDLKCAYVECSAKYGEGVDKVFEEVSSPLIYGLLESCFDGILQALAAALQPRKVPKKSRCRML